MENGVNTFCICTNYIRCTLPGDKMLPTVGLDASHFRNFFVALWTLKVAQGGILFGKWMWEQEVTSENVGESQQQAGVRGGGGRKACDSAGAGGDMRWPNAEHLSSAGGGWQPLVSPVLWVGTGSG